jgi:hypothetical protein
MKNPIFTRALIVLLLSGAATAKATIVTTGAHDFHGATPTDQASMEYSTYAAENGGAATVLIVATVKRNPASSGTQTVTIEGLNSHATETLRGVVYSLSGTSLTTKTFFVPAAFGVFSRTVTFTDVQAPSTAYFDLQINLPPGSYMTGAYAN